MSPAALSPAMSRRDLLRIGVLGAGWSALSLPRLLGAEAIGKAPTPVRAVILLAHYGGPSHIDLWDPKPDAPPEIRGEFATIDTRVPGLRMTDQLPMTARLTDRLTVIRSMTHSVANHNPQCYSIAMAGGGVRRGHVHGGSDPIGAYPTSDSVSPADLAATVLWALGIDPETTIKNQFGQPFTATTGRPLPELFG